ncbi:MAG: peptidoglycan-binding protein [Candidatus Omnitrophica bacterium]|nr:peptidoglycan-binding protein [Candidatus Omnitrophota bacterium]MBI5144808.1 peptidoglycan-binding protein [Candidatus Omnitrophota bacterium]
MKRILFFVLLSVLTVSLASCGKKETALEELQEPASIEGLTAPETETVEATATVVAPAPAASENLPPAGPYQPTNIEIQTALKNANYYTGPIDGKIGPLSKEAIKKFQQDNGLEADGKVGSKTWAVLGASLNKPAAPKAKKKR